MPPSQPLHAQGVLISHEFQPIAEVGGDYLDYFTLSDGTVGIYVGDVSGKGLPAALCAALAVETIRGVHKTGQSPGSVLSLLNKRLHLPGIPGRHTAIQYSAFNPESGEMRITSAGMPGPVLLRNRHSKVLQIAGVPPGLFPSIAYDEFSLHLQPGDSVLYCSDGLPESRNSRGEEFGVEGLQHVCLRYAQEGPVELLGHVFSAINEFNRDCRQWDDMTSVVFHYVTRGELCPC